MNNPFIFYSGLNQKPYLTPLCSVNKLKIAKAPTESTRRFEGKTASELMGAAAVCRYIEDECRLCGIDGFTGYETLSLPRFLSDGCVSGDEKLRAFCQRVADDIGERLAAILLTLKTALPENRAARPDWGDEHWRYLQNAKRFILTGGLTAGHLGERFKKKIFQVFAEAGAAPYEISVFENSSLTGVMGGARLLSQKNCTAAVLDCGQTGIKRCVFRLENGEIVSQLPLESLPSRHMQLPGSPLGLDRDEAIKLHRLLIGAVCSVCREAMRFPDFTNEIIISIANYVEGGCIINPTRGGYAKLSLLSDNYAELLETEISAVVRTPLKVTLVHDATAVAAYFREEKGCVCLTLGTGFGIGFTDFFDF